MVPQPSRRRGGGRGHRTFTGTPEQVADTIEEWAREGAADGFNIMPAALPSGFELFAEHVVPILRRRGLIRDTSEEAWNEAEARVARMAAGAGSGSSSAFGGGSGGGAAGKRWGGAVGQRRLLDLAERGDVLDSCLYTAPGKYGGGGAGTTWLVGSAAEVAAALREYAALGLTHFVLSDTPYREEAVRIGDQLLPLLR